jgi:hypothetical protein
MHIASQSANSLDALAIWSVALAALTGLLGIATAILTAVFGSSQHSERAFRLLRWLGRRPEPGRTDAEAAKDGHVESQP